MARREVTPGSFELNFEVGVGSFEINFEVEVGGARTRTL